MNGDPHMTRSLLKPSNDFERIKWVWVSGATYLAGFDSHEAAIEYGKRNGWINGNGTK